MFPQEIIRKKRNHLPLSLEEIVFFIQGVTQGEVTDAQIAALTMAIYLNGMDTIETTQLTLAMRDSGDVLRWHLPGPIIDKHSTGGVGDKVSIMLAPILACCGGYVPMIAGRGLGHTGGTLDKLDSIPGYKTTVDNQTFAEIVRDIGCAIIGQTANLAPADKKIYAIRDVCGTVESIPLITASILAKKLAAGLEYLVMDLKCGTGAFMETETAAHNLARSIVDVANNAGTKTTALITDMNQVLGYNVGNALEIREAIEYMQNKKVCPRLDSITKALCSQLLVDSKICKSKQEAETKITKVLTSGRALEKFSQMVASLGAPLDFVEKFDQYLPKANIVCPVFSKCPGYLQSMDVRDIGMSIIGLKGGRTHPAQKLDYATGYSEFCQIGDYVDNHKPLAIVHAQTEEQFVYAAAEIRQRLVIGEDKPMVSPQIMAEVR